MMTTTTPTRPAAGTPSRSLLASPSSLSRSRPPPSPLTFADRHVPSARSLFGGGATATIAAAAAASPFDAALALDEQRRGGGAGTAAAGAAASRSSSSSSRGGVGGAGGVVGTSGSATAGANAAADAGGNQGNARPSSAGGNGQGASTYGALLRAQLLGAAAAGTGAGAAGGAGTATTGPVAAATAAAPSPIRPQQQHFGSPSAAAASATTPATPSRRPRILSFVHDDASAAFASPARRSINAFGSGIGGGGGNNDVDDFRFDDDDGVLLQNHHSSPQQRRRRVPRAPFKILDAPALADDFYLNLVDWSSQNVLAVGLGPCVYLWSAATSGVTKLCDLSEESEIASAASALARAYPGGSAVPQIQAGVGDAVCSVSWSQRGQYLAVGTGSGLVQVFDVARAGESGGGGGHSSASSSSAKLRTYAGHRARVSSLSWGSATLSTGSRDRSVAQRDVRCPEPLAARLSGHRSEVCGLRASPDDRLLASGGNDNALLVWDTRRLFSSSSSSGAGGGQGGGGQQRWREQQQQQQRRQQQHRLMQRSGGGTVAASNSSSSASAAAAAAAAAAEAAEYSGGLDESSIPNVSTPLFRFTEHTAAVKALAWSPHAHGLLASGGGTADRCIRFWSTTGSGNGGNGSAASDTTLASASAPNTTTAATSNNDACLGAIDTGSQVCNLAWAKHANELASTHGYSQNAVALWRYPTMARVATLTGHSTRVLYLAASPDGRSIVTGAGDETLRFWSVFPGPRGESNGGGGACGLGGASRARGGGGVAGGAVVASSPAGKGHAAATTPLSGLARSWLR